MGETHRSTLHARSDQKYSQAFLDGVIANCFASARLEMLSSLCSRSTSGSDLAWISTEQRGISLSENHAVHKDSSRL